MDAITPNVISDVQRTWAKVTDFQAAGDLFYKNLFTANPTLPGTMFKGVDMKAQSVKTLTMIDKAVKLLQRPDELVPILTRSGARHVLYGSEDAHYPAVGAALLATLQAALGDEFTDEVRSSWEKVYGVMQSAMIAGAHSEEGERYKSRVKAHRVNRLVTSSWKDVGTDFAAAGALFYKNLFELAPSLATTLFKNTDMPAQGVRVIKMVDSAVKLLDNEPELTKVLHDAGRRHVKYGAEEAHYPVVGQALLATLSQALGDKFDDEVRDAWTTVYGAIQRGMLEGQRSVSA